MSFMGIEATVEAVATEATTMCVSSITYDEALEHRATLSSVHFSHASGVEISHGIDPDYGEVIVIVGATSNGSSFLIHQPMLAQ